MKLGIDRGELDAITAWAAKALPARPAYPVMAAIRLEASDGTLTASGFDFHTAATATADARVDEPGEALVPGRLLASVVHSLDSEDAELALDGSRLTLSCDGSRFGLVTLPDADEYPAFPELPPAAGSCDGGLLAAALARVIVAAGADDTLPVLTGVLAETSGDAITLVTSDRYRMAVATVPWEPASAEAAGPSALIPAKVLAGIVKDLKDAGQVTISLAGDRSMAGFTAARRQIVTRSLDGEYPNWRKLSAGAGQDATVHAGSVQLLAAIRRAALTAGTGMPVITVTIGDSQVQVTGSDDGNDSAITVEAVTDGEPLTLQFRPGFLADGLAAAGGGVLLQFAAKGNRVLITPDRDGDDYRHLLMAVRAS